MKTNQVEFFPADFREENRVINLSELADRDLSYYKTADYKKLNVGDFTIRYDLKHRIRLACLKVLDSLGQVAYLVLDKCSLDKNIENGLASGQHNGLSKESYSFINRAVYGL